MLVHLLYKTGERYSSTLLQCQLTRRLPRPPLHGKEVSLVFVFASQLSVSVHCFWSLPLSLALTLLGAPSNPVTASVAAPAPRYVYVHPESLR